MVFQSVDDLPEGFVRPEGRTKPWGTNHAVLMGKAVIREPFAVINADDFYGRDGFRVLGQCCRKPTDRTATAWWATAWATPSRRAAPWRAASAEPMRTIT